jgi:hypothetical protein
MALHPLIGMKTWVRTVVAPVVAAVLVTGLVLPDASANRFSRSPRVTQSQAAQSRNLPSKLRRGAITRRTLIYTALVSAVIGGVASLPFGGNLRERKLEEAGRVVPADQVERLSGQGGSHVPRQAPLPANAPKPASPESRAESGKSAPKPDAVKSQQ